MMKKKKLYGRMVKILIFIPPEIHDKVRKVAAAEYRSVSSVVRQSIATWLEHWEKGERS